MGIQGLYRFLGCINMQKDGNVRWKLLASVKGSGFVAFA